MTTYKIKFEGRTVGAIGIFQQYTETVEAASKEEAVLRLYDRYEHIRVVSLNEVEG